MIKKFKFMSIMFVFAASCVAIQMEAVARPLVAVYRSPTLESHARAISRRANAVAKAIKTFGELRVVKRGKTPELLLTEKGVYFNDNFLRLGDSMTLWRKVLKGTPRCSGEKPVPEYCVWDALGIALMGHGGTKDAVFQLKVYINLEVDPYEGLVTHSPDGTPLAPRIDWSPKQAFSGYLELDGYGIDAVSKLWEIRAAIEPKRNVTCGLRDCASAKGVLGKDKRLFLSPKDGRESEILNTLVLSID